VLSSLAYEGEAPFKLLYVLFSMSGFARTTVSVEKTRAETVRAFSVRYFARTTASVEKTHSGTVRPFSVRYFARTTNTDLFANQTSWH
jgi:hypothetical protein